jgi:hypothetical protein
MHSTGSAYRYLSQTRGFLETYINSPLAYPAPDYGAINEIESIYNFGATGLLGFSQALAPLTLSLRLYTLSPQVA